MSDDKCPTCNTAATFKLSDKSYGCKCTYDFEEEIDRLNEQLIQRGYNLGYADGLAHGKLEGVDEAEERILKLLGRKLAKLIQEMRECDSDDAQRIVVGQVSAFQEVIKLIKGEQK